MQNTVNNLQNNSYTSSNKPYVIGHYQGDGIANRTISLDFTPVCVIVMMCGSYIGVSRQIQGGMATTGHGATSINNNIGLNIVSNGFKCYYNESLGVYTNHDYDYNYIAFR